MSDLPTKHSDTSEIPLDWREVGADEEGNLIPLPKPDPRVDEYRKSQEQKIQEYRSSPAYNKNNEDSFRSMTERNINNFKKKSK